MRVVMLNMVSIHAMNLVHVFDNFGLLLLRPLLLPCAFWLGCADSETNL
jgi:hypothetical protein